MYKSILVPLDGSVAAEQALPFAAQLARAMTARLILAQAAFAEGEVSDALTQLQARLTQAAQAYLAPLARRLADEGLAVAIATPAARPADAILMAMDLNDVDLVVMTTRGRSALGRWAFGSVAEAVLSQTGTPVFLVRATDKARHQPCSLANTRFLVALDGSFFAEAALPHAVTLAHAFGAPLILLRVVTPPEGQPRGHGLPSEPVVEAINRGVTRANEYLHALAETLREQRLTVEIDVQVGGAAETILAEGQDCSLVIMTTHGRTGLARLTAGSVAMNVLRHGAHPLLVVRPTPLMAGSQQVNLNAPSAAIHS